MVLAKNTTKGQITIPIDIRRKLGVKEGDEVLFIEESGRIYITNFSMNALLTAQASFAGEAKRAGLSTEQDAVELVREIRKERQAYR